MQLRSEIQLATMISAMKDVVIPAVDASNDLAVQQAHIIVGLLNLMAHQLPMQFRFDRDELQRLTASAQRLSQLQTQDLAIGEAARQLAACHAQAGAVLERCAADPAELSAAVRDMREATSALVIAAERGSDKATLELVEKVVLDLSKAQLKRDRSLMLPLGWEADPALIPAIDSLIE